MADTGRRSDNRVYLAAVRDGGAAHLQVRVEGRRRFAVSGTTSSSSSNSSSTGATVSGAPLSWLHAYGVERLRLSVHRRAAQEHPAAPLDGAGAAGAAAPPSSAFPGPSGLRVTARLRPAGAGGPADGPRAAFLQILRRLVGERWVAAPLVSLDPDGREWHLDVAAVAVGSRTASNDDQGPRVEIGVTLPFLGDPLAAEGLRMLLRWEAALARAAAAADPDGGAPLLAALQPNATVWSQVLLGRLAATDGNGIGAGSHDHRGLWMEWTVPDTRDGRGLDEDRLQGQWDYGLYYTRPVPPSAVVTAASKRGRRKDSGADHVDLMFRDLIPMAVAPVMDEDYGDDPCCALSNVTVLAAASTTEEKQKHREAIIELANLEAVPGSPSCRAELAESVLSIPILNPAPDPIWSVAMHIDYEGYGRGRLVARVENRHASCKAAVRLRQVVPRVLQPVWQSLQVTVAPQPSQASDDDSTCATNSSLEATVAWASLDRHSIDFLAKGSVQLSLEHVVPVDSSLQLTLDFDPMFLPFESFPGDPNRGFELPPLVAYMETLECPVATYTDLFSNAVLFLPPLPDMSMPFNVLSLTCTLYVFVIGSIMNHLVRKASDYVRYTLHPDHKPKSKLQRLKERVRGLVRREPRQIDKAQEEHDRPIDGDGDQDVGEQHKQLTNSTPKSDKGRENNAQDIGGNSSDPLIEESPAKVLLDELLWMPSPK